MKQSVKKKRRIFPKSSFCRKKMRKKKNAFQYWQMQEKNYKNTSLSTINWTVKNEDYDSCLLTEEEIKKEQKQIDGWQEEIIRKETQQKEELEQQKKDKALLDSAELELQKAETKKTEGLRKKKELEGLIALVKEFQGLIMPRKSSRKNIRFPLKKYKSREKFTRNCFRVFWTRRQGSWRRN